MLAQIFRFIVTFTAFELAAEVLLTSLLISYPGTQLERRLVADMLIMIAYQLGYPIAELILMEPDYLPFHFV